MPATKRHSCLRGALSLALCVTAIGLAGLPGCVFFPEPIFLQPARVYIMRATLVDTRTGMRQRVTTADRAVTGGREFTVCEAAPSTAGMERSLREWKRFLGQRVVDPGAPAEVRARFSSAEWCLADAEFVTTRRGAASSCPPESSAPELAACSASVPRACGQLTAPPGTPEISLSASNLAFGTLPLGGMTPGSRSLTVTNSGGGLLCLDEYGLDPLVAATADFSVLAGSCRPTSTEELRDRVIALGAGTRSSCTFEVRFNPTAAGARSSRLIVLSNAANTPLASLGVVGAGDPGVLTVTPAPVCLDGPRVADAAGTGFERRASVTLTNTGAGALTVTSIALPATATAYRVVGSTPGPLPTTLAPSERLTLELAVRSDFSEPRLDPALLTIATNGMPATFSVELLPLASGCTSS